MLAKLNTRCLGAKRRDVLTVIPVVFFHSKEKDSKRKNLLAHDSTEASKREEALCSGGKKVYESFKVRIISANTLLQTGKEVVKQQQMCDL